ncbi:MAG: SDR family oxidoreductase [bacterium]|nr:SDR family oxidoreductase [bacterium]
MGVIVADGDGAPIEEGDARVVIVTGALGGMGRAISEALQAGGWTIAGLDLPDAVASRADHGFPGLLLGADITSTGDLESSFDEVTRLAATPTALVNCAGVGAADPLVHMSLDRVRKVIEVNLIAAIAAMSLFARHWIAGESRRPDNVTGAIVNISSLAAYGSNPGQSAYVSSKAGLVGATRVAANELGPLGVRVNAILPSFASTPLTAATTDDVRANYLSRTPLGRFPDLHEVAATVAWLLSPDASYVSGAELRVTGGRLF